jgi:AcrR family transcriptional regulator
LSPKDTFHRIPEAKRERVLREAARLFARRGLAQTDMAELAARAGVAKGSLYNYFSSKEEFYEHVCRDGLERSRQAVYGGLDPEWDVYRQVEHIFRAGMRFAQDHPEYVAMYLNVASAGMEPLAERLSEEVEAYTAGHLKRLLARDLELGRVRPDLDVPLAAFLINSLYIMFLASLASPHYRLRLRVYLEIEGRLDGGSLERHLERTISLIHGFLRPAPPEAPKEG